MALAYGEETLYGVNDIPERMAKLKAEGCDLLPIPLREKAIESLRAEQAARRLQHDMAPWEGIVGKMGWFQFATPVITGTEPGQKQEANNLAIGRAVAVMGGTVAIEYAMPIDYKGKRAFYRGYVPAQAIVSFLEVASETDAPPAPVTLIRP